MSKRKAKSTSKPKVIDAVVIPVVGQTLVRANGTLDLSATSPGVLAWRISRGHYNVQFRTLQKIAMVEVMPVQKVRAPRIFARVQPFVRNCTTPKDLIVVEVFLTSRRGTPRDCDFAALAIAAGATQAIR